MSLLDDWSIFFSDTSAFSTGHFANLFREHHRADEIGKICAPFQQGERAATRLQEFFEENVRSGYWRPDEHKRASKYEALAIATDLKKEIATLLYNNNSEDLSQEIGAIPVSFLDDCKRVEENTRRDDIVHVDYVDLVSDIFRGSYLAPTKIIVELKEAAYQLTTSLDVTRYLIAPLTSMPNSFDKAYKFWLKGGVYCFTNEAMEISVLPR